MVLKEQKFIFFAIFKVPKTSLERHTFWGIWSHCATVMHSHAQWEQRTKEVHFLLNLCNFLF